MNQLRVLWEHRSAGYRFAMADGSVQSAAALPGQAIFVLEEDLYADTAADAFFRSFRNWYGSSYGCRSCGGVLYKIVFAEGDELKIRTNKGGAEAVRIKRAFTCAKCARFVTSAASQYEVSIIERRALSTGEPVLRGKLGDANNFEYDCRSREEYAALLEQLDSWGTSRGRSDAGYLWCADLPESVLLQEKAPDAPQGVEDIAAAEPPLLAVESTSGERARRCPDCAGVLVDAGTPFGFPRASCSSCQEVVTFPLTNGARILFWIVLVIALIGAVAMYAGGSLMLPGGITVLAIFLLVRDGVLRLNAGDAGEVGFKILPGWFWVLALLLVLVYAAVLAPPVHWTKVDAPEHPETFRTETTSTRVVVESKKNPCWVGQDWVDCTNSMIYEYNNACVGTGADTGGTWSICGQYRTEITTMQRDAQAGWVVSSLGGHGKLRVKTVKKKIRVSNNDYRPAVTHTASCYFGFVGECER